MQKIYYADLDESLVNKIEELANPTLPQGQSFFLQDGDVVAIEKSLYPLFLAQNSQSISTGDIQEIVFEEED
jgi:hypothetical protein